MVEAQTSTSNGWTACPSTPYNRSMSRQSELFTIASAVRSFLEPVWLEWHEAWGEVPAISSRWVCTRSSLFLQKVLRDDFGLAASWKSGTPRLRPDGPEFGGYGFLTPRGWESHAWVEAEGWILDMTLDQFGASPVVVTAATDPRYSAGDGPSALPEFSAARTQAVEELWPKWLASDLRQSVINIPAR